MKWSTKVGLSLDKRERERLIEAAQIATDIGRVAGSHDVRSKASVAASAVAALVEAVQAKAANGKPETAKAGA